MKILMIISIFYMQLFSAMVIEEAWLSMKENNDGFKASNNDVKRAKLKQDSAKSMYLPSISLSGTYTHLDEPIGMDISGISGAVNGVLGAVGRPAIVPSELEISEQDIFLADLRLLWPLYVGGKIDAMQDIHKARVDEAKALHHMKEDKSFLKLVKTYYGVVVLESLYNTRVEAQNALLIHFDNAQKLKQEGQIAKVELLNAEVNLDSAKIQTTKAKHKFEIASSSLAKMTKKEDNPESKLFVNKDLEDENHYKDEMLQHYAPLHVLDSKSKQSSAYIDIKEASYKPQVVGFANYNLYKDDSVMMELVPQWMAGLNVKIDLLQRKDRSQELQAAKLLSSKMNYLTLQAKEDLKLLLEKTYKEMELYRDEFYSLNSSLELANENYRLRTIAFSEGLATSIEVIDAQLFLASVKTSRLNAAYNYVQKVSQLCVLSGNSDEFFNIVNISQEIK